MNSDIMDGTNEKVTANDFMDNIYLSVAWDEMHGCVEAAPSDCPHEEIMQRIFSTLPPHEKLRECAVDDDKLSSFIDSALSADVMLTSEGCDDRDVKELEGLCRLALRVHTAAKKLPVDAPLNKWRHRCHQPLIDGTEASTPPEKVALSNVLVPLPEIEASQWVAQSALQVRAIEVMALLGVRLDEEVQKCGLGKVIQPSSSTASKTEELAASTILDSLSPLEKPGRSEFCCAVFHSSNNDDCHNPSNTKQFYRLHRYSHLATTSLIRQLDAFGIHLPVFGVLLSGSRIAFHIDWATSIDGRLELDSALYTPDEMGEDFKQWDLCRPDDALEVALILDNLRRYAFGQFRSSVTSGLSDLGTRIYSGDISAFSAWRWDGKMLVDRGDENINEQEYSPSLSSVEFEEEGESKDEEDRAINVQVRDTDTDDDQAASVELLTAVLTLEQKAGIARRSTKRILPSPPRTPAEEFIGDSQAPSSETQ